MERQINFKRDVADYINSLIKLPKANRIITKYERGLITLEEAMRELRDNEIELLRAENMANDGNGMFFYGMRLRPFDVNCQPSEGFLGTLYAPSIDILSEDEKAKYHDIIAYSRKLTEREVKHFSLDYLGVLGGAA